MTKTTTNLLGILITILAGTYFFMRYCSECGAVTKKGKPTAKEEVMAEELPEATAYPFAFSDGDYTFTSNDNFDFNASSSSILLPVTQNIENGISSIRSFLKSDTGKVLDITGFYKSDETNSTAFPNLGLARATAVKNFLVSKGVLSSQLNTFGSLRDDMVAQDNIFMGPLGYEIGGASDTEEEELQEIYKRIKDKPLVLNFKTAQTSINLYPEQRQKIAEIARYLDKVEGASCSVIGHTDNEGGRALNTKLGQERADFAKAYLVQNGIPESKITASSKGPDSPVASNATEEGRAQNRRTIVTLN